MRTVPRCDVSEYSVAIKHQVQVAQCWQVTNRAIPTQRNYIHWVVRGVERGLVSQDSDAEASFPCRLPSSCWTDRPEQERVYRQLYSEESLKLGGEDSKENRENRASQGIFRNVRSFTQDSKNPDCLFLAQVLSTVSNIIAYVRTPGWNLFKGYHELYCDHSLQLQPLFIA